MSLNPNEIADVSAVLQGYETWRKMKVQQLERSDYHLSPSHYLDDYAKLRALEIVEQLQAVYSNDELTWQEVDAEVRNILGVQR